MKKRTRDWLAMGVLSLATLGCSAGGGGNRLTSWWPRRQQTPQTLPQQQQLAQQGLFGRRAPQQTAPQGLPGATGQRNPLAQQVQPGQQKLTQQQLLSQQQLAQQQLARKALGGQPLPGQQLPATQLSQQQLAHQQLEQALMQSRQQNPLAARQALATQQPSAQQALATAPAGVAGALPWQRPAQAQQALMEELNHPPGTVVPTGIQQTQFAQAQDTAAAVVGQTGPAAGLPKAALPTAQGASAGNKPGVLRNAFRQAFNGGRQNDPAKAWVSTTQGLPFVVGFENGRIESQATGKPAMYFVTTQSCYWCKKLGKDCFNDAAVRSMLDGEFVCVIVDAEREPAIAEALGATHYPHVVFQDAGGTELASTTGYKNAAQFGELLKQVQQASTVAAR